MKRFRLTGDELSRYVSFEGTVRVGVKSRPPAEFTLPPLPFDFPVGLVVEAENVAPHSVFGFTVENMAEGVLVAGGSAEERVNTLLRILGGSSKLGWNIAAATSRNLARVRSVAPQARVYDGFPLNPLDPEEAGGAEYASALSLTLQSALGLTGGQRLLLEDAIAMCMDEGALTLEELKEKVREAAVSELRSQAERREAELLHRELGLTMSLKGAEKLSPANPSTLRWMVEAPTVALLWEPRLAAVAQASLLAKAMCLEVRGFSVLVELDCFAEPEPLAGVFRRLREKEVGVVALSPSVSHAGSAASVLGNRVIHRLEDGGEAGLVGRLMGLREEGESVQSGRRHRLYQVEVLRFLEWGEAVVQRSDNPSPVLVVFEMVEGGEARAEPVSGAGGGRTPLEVDFGSDAADALKVIQLVHDFPQITLSQVVGGLPEIGEKARVLALRLADRGYLASFRDGRGRRVFVVTRRGEDALRRVRGGG
ncbi:MAG: hypothetical protein QW461_10625 [Candidatus Jordarchaeales archaeon]